MGLEQYQGLLYLSICLSFFVIMLLSLRLLSSRQQIDHNAKDESSWFGIEELLIIEVIQETHNIKSFRFQRKDSKLFPVFFGGQFISFQIGDDPSLVRSYSISSNESNKKVVQVSIKKITDGKGSAWFHSLKPGDTVKAHVPSGHFIDEGQGQYDRIFIGGGIGITPLLSIILSNIEKALSVNMTLFYAVRSQEDLAFHKHLELLASRHQNFKYFPIISHDDAWSGDKGFLTLDFIKDKIGPFKDQAIYICGPGVMSEPILQALDKMNYNEDKIYTEKFISPMSLEDLNLPEREVAVSWLGQSYNYKGRDNLLSFLESQGQSLPFACRSGVCGSCKCKIKGPYFMLTNSGLTRKEQKEGLALACVSFPEADVEIDHAN